VKITESLMNLNMKSAQSQNRKLENIAHREFVEVLS